VNNSGSLFTCSSSSSNYFANGSY